MKIGVFTVGLPEYNIEESAELLKEMGYDAVEWRVGGAPKADDEDFVYERRYWSHNKSTLLVDNIEEEAKRAKKASDQAGLEILALTTYLGTDKTEELTRVIRTASAIGCPMVRLGITTHKTGTENYPQLFDQLRDNLKTWEPLLLECGVKLVLEIHHQSLVSSPSAAYRALEGLNPKCFGLIFDPGNMVNEGYEDYLKSFELLKDYICHVHVKNSMLVPDGEDEFGACKWKQVWVPLRKGQADLRYLFTVMKKMGYAGNISMEDFSNEKSTREKLEDNLSYVKMLIEAAEKSERRS